MLTVWYFSQPPGRSRRKSKVLSGVAVELTLYSRLDAHQVTVSLPHLSISKRLPTRLPPISTRMVQSSFLMRSKTLLSAMPELRLSTANVTLNSEEKRNYLDAMKQEKQSLTRECYAKSEKKTKNIAFSE